MNGMSTHELVLSPSFAERLTAPVARELSPELARLGAGLALAALYGLALGAREGGLSLLQHSLGAPLALALLVLLLTPSLAVLFALFDAPLAPVQVFSAIARSVSLAGLALAGLAPATALFAVTVDSAALVTTIVRLGCLLAGTVALGQLLSTLWDALAAAAPASRGRARLLCLSFGAFVLVLAGRLFSILLPVLGGAS